MDPVKRLEQLERDKVRLETLIEQAEESIKASLGSEYPDVETAITQLNTKLDKMTKDYDERLNAWKKRYQHLLEKD